MEMGKISILTKEKEGGGGGREREREREMRQGGKGGSHRTAVVDGGEEERGVLGCLRGGLSNAQRKNRKGERQTERHRKAKR